MNQDTVWNVVGVVFILEYVLPPLARGVKWVRNWFKDLRDLREDLYEPTDDEYEDDDE